MKNQKNNHKEEITRNEAIKKMGKYACLDGPRDLYEF